MGTNMTLFQGKWIKLTPKADGPCARSSHAVAVVRRKAYVFGGELEPRVPIDNKLHVFDLDTHSWSIVDVSGDAPPPRVGVTMAAVKDKIYVFGGRDGTHKELNEFYSFDTVTNEWQQLSSGEEGPPARSYHATASDDQHVYIFGGCGVDGRLSDLWAYEVDSDKWVKFKQPSHVLKGRGGPGLAVSMGKVWVIYGFSGEELDDVHFYDLEAQEWGHVETKGEKPSPRSVFATVGFGNHILIYGGEVDPSDLGHLGAGAFTGDMYSLNTETLTWHKWETSGDHHPGPRGWSAFSSAGEGMLVYGGNSPSNARLDDIFLCVPSFG
ncbi:nitrile-specifier protein 5 [Amborella trichopoda]|uniref:nitrile-specifier protein 5 n=1 Tax=Amborella trichopoda TaxID=13333 RepID=UPI0005D3F90C|nr:nitrile-specifier protein 5 [Amborella trichopoda]|eukprot:XP_011623227.1 nitrile-specifier protein 5 [Amborella trichopoda]